MISKLKSNIKESTKKKRLITLKNIINLVLEFIKYKNKKNIKMKNEN